MNFVKSLVVFFVSIALLCGCASYKYLSDVKGYNKGFVVSRNDTIIPEYTRGRENKFPEELNRAQQRFKRRRRKVEYYYRKMDLLYSPLWTSLSYPYALAGVALGVARFPFILISDFRYERSAVYRMKVDERKRRINLAEERRRRKLREALEAFVRRDLEKETKGGGENDLNQKADP